MSEYKENTVGWHLSRLKEPLRSRALAYAEDDVLGMEVKSMWDALDYLYRFGVPHADYFILGAKDCFKACYDHGCSQKSMGYYDKGWLMAEKCMPDLWLEGRHDGRMNSPKHEEHQSEIYSDGARSGLEEYNLGIIKFHRPKECVPDPEVVNPPVEEKAPYGSFLYHMGRIPRVNPMKCTNEELKDSEGNPVVLTDEQMERLESLMKGVDADAPIPPLDLVSTGLGVMDTGNHPRLTYEPMEVVHGYTPPRPVETIEGRHDRELKEQDARIAALEAQIKALHEFIGEIVCHSNNIAYYVRSLRGNTDGMGNTYSDNDPTDIETPNFE